MTSPIHPEDRVTKNVGINALRTARTRIEDMLAAASIQMTNDHHTIQTQAECIAEGDAVIDRQQLEIAALKEFMRSGADKIVALQAEVQQLRTRPRSQSPVLRWWERDNPEMYFPGPGVGKSQAVFEHCADAAAAKRARNVARLASAAIKQFNVARTTDIYQSIDNAIAFLKPLATGVHDVYKYHGATDRSSEARPSDNARDIQGFGPFGWEDGQQ